jgi:hypothetical protein
MFSPLMINLFGSDKDIETASHEIAQVCKINGLKTKIVSIEPTCLASTPANTIPNWRMQIEKELYQQHDIIINKAGESNCDEITDLCRSIRALSYTTHPYAFKVEKDVKTLEEKIKILDTCNQLNMVYSLKTEIPIKIKDIEKFIK